MKSPTIHVWIPDYDSGMGGIQMFSRFLIQALRDCTPGARLAVLSKNDVGFPSDAPDWLPREFYYSGRWPRRYRTGAFTWQLVRAALRDRPDLILSTHVNFMPVALFLKRMTGVRYVAVAHGVDVWGVPRRGLHRALRSADRMLAVSRFTRDRMLAEMGLEPGQVGLLPNTLDAGRFKPAAKPPYLLKRFGLRESQPVILTVARLDSADGYKGYDQVLRALSAIRAAVPDTRYIIGGKGNDRPRLDALVQKLNLEDAVTFAGYIADEELGDFYNLCDVFAMPSKGEGFGIVFLEALACGKPVLGGNKDGSVDALLDGALGVLVDPDNVSEITEALIAMLRGRHPLEILREPKRLRAAMVEAYGYERFVEHVATHLRELGLEN